MIALLGLFLVFLARIKAAEQCSSYENFQIISSGGLPSPAKDVISSVEVEPDVQVQCNVLCYQEPKCVAFNFRHTTKAENCQLLNSIKGRTSIGGGDWTTFVNVDAAKKENQEEENTRTGYPSTCSRLKLDEPETNSGYHMIQPNKDEPPFTVFCDMADKNGVGATTFSHDSETSTHVSGYESRGAYRKIITYSDLTMEQIVNVINASRFCEQFIKWYCKNAGLYLVYDSPDSWWVSRQGNKMDYWGGATPGSRKCACGVNNSCMDPGRTCNCDSAHGNAWQEDSGFLVQKEYLPVSELRFGDTGDTGEEGYHTLGKLSCWG